MYGRPDSGNKQEPEWPGKKRGAKNKKGRAAMPAALPVIERGKPLGFNGSLSRRGSDPEPDHTMLRTKAAPNDRSLVKAKPRLIVTDIGSPPFAD